MAASVQSSADAVLLAQCEGAAHRIVDGLIGVQVIARRASAGRVVGVDGGVQPRGERVRDELPNGFIRIAAASACRRANGGAVQSTEFDEVDHSSPSFK